MTTEEFFKFMMTQYFISKGLEIQNNHTCNCNNRHRVGDNVIPCKIAEKPKYGNFYMYRFGENTLHIVKITDILDDKCMFIDFSCGCVEKKGYLGFLYELPIHINVIEKMNKGNKHEPHCNCLYEYAGEYSPTIPDFKVHKLKDGVKNNPTVNCNETWKDIKTMINSRIEELCNKFRYEEAKRLEIERNFIETALKMSGYNIN